MGFWRNNRPYGRRRPKGPPPRLRPPPTPRREYIDPKLHNIKRTTRYLSQNTMQSTKLQVDFHLICIIKRFPADVVCGSRIPTTYNRYTTHLINRECHRRGFYTHQGPIIHRPRLPPFSPIIHDIYEDLLVTPQKEPAFDSSSYSHPELFLKLALLLLFTLSFLSWCTGHHYELSQLQRILSDLFQLNASKNIFHLLSGGYSVFCNLPLLFHTTNLPPILHLVQLSHQLHSFTSALSSSFYYNPDFFLLYRRLLIDGVLYSGITLILYTLFKRHTFPHHYKRFGAYIHIIYQRIHVDPCKHQLQSTSNTIKHNTNFSIRRFLLLYVSLIICLRIPLNIMSTNNNTSNDTTPSNQQPDRLAEILNAVTGVRTDINRLSSRIDVLERPSNDTTSPVLPGGNNPIPPQQNVQPHNVWDEATAPISPLGASTSNNTNGSNDKNNAPSIPSPPTARPNNTDGFTTVVHHRHKNNNAHALVSSVQYCKKNCPANHFGELAALISSAVHAHEIFDTFTSWGQAPKGTGAAKRP